MAITTVDLPHSLGRAGAKARLQANVGQLAAHIPGGVAAVETRWPGPDRMVIEVAALGQQVTATLDIEDALVRVSFDLPGMLGFMSAAIAAAVRREGGRLLLPPD
jgi:hypothetical protein